MQAIRLSRFGGPEVLESIEMPIPSPGAGEALIRMRAAGVNYFEVLLRQNRYAVTPDLPMVLGVEVAGIVEAIGPGVTAPVVGARVAAPLFAMGRAGGYAEHVLADASQLVALPEGLAFESAVGLMVQGLTALHLTRRSVPEGKSVLITASAGGVGSLLIQLARSAGAHLVIAAAGSAKKCDLARSLGADVAVDYANPGWAQEVLTATGGQGVDIAYDLVGGAQAGENLGVLAPAGELVFTAMGRFELGRQELEALLGRNQSLKGFALLPLLTQGNLGADLEDLFTRNLQGKLKLISGGHFPLARVAEAHAALESRRSTGKIVLTA